MRILFQRNLLSGLNLENLTKIYHLKGDLKYDYCFSCEHVDLKKNIILINYKYSFTIYFIACIY